MMVLSRRRPLYRKARLAVISLALVAAAALAQTGMKHSHRLRAIALVELYGPASKPTGGRIVPIAIKVEDKFYDAETYDATPRPLALDPGTVYEALNNGESAGFFTVAAAKQQKGDWFGVGQWKSAAEVQRAEAAAAAAKKARDKMMADEGPPKLQKGGEKPLPAGTAKPDTTAKPADEPHTVTLHKEPKPATIPEPSSDPDRPTLRHGGGEQVSGTLEPPPPTAAPKPGLNTRPGGPTQVLVAVSDPDGTGPLRSYAFPWKPEEERTLKAKTIALAEAEIGKYIAARAGSAAKPSERKAGRAAGKHLPQAPAVKLVNPMVVAYDLNLDNNAELVVSGSVGQYYVTLIARTDLEFVPQKIYAVVTDKDHLDAVPRMELVGPVDAEGKGKPDLLFRALSDTSYKYALFRVHRDEAWSFWESGSYEQ